LWNLVFSPYPAIIAPDSVGSSEVILATALTGVLLFHKRLGFDETGDPISAHLSFRISGLVVAVKIKEEPRKVVTEACGIGRAAVCSNLELDI
jgi:hypothetical protein